MMSVVNHECVVATTWSSDVMRKVEEWVQLRNEAEIEQFVFAEAPCNGIRTCVLTPDGSKKGWQEASLGETTRDDFIEFLETFDYDDGSSPFSWVEVGYGEFGQKVLRGNNKNVYSDKDYEE